MVLGILAPDDQKEDWHWALTDRNERRLPEALRSQLMAGKRKAEQALKRQAMGHADPQSYFLVEFLGSHEFIWVRETDIVESFEPDDDPNKKMQESRKKHRSGGRLRMDVVGTKRYQGAIEEASWALEEFEMQLQDACGDREDDEEGEDGNYSYTVLCVSDDEADEAYGDEDEQKMTPDQLEEANELIATRGLMDFSVTGRKNAKKRVQALKKQKQDLEKKSKAKRDKSNDSRKKGKDSTASKPRVRTDKKEQKELERRRKKRTKEREKAISKSAKKKLKGITADSTASGDLLLDKRARATALCKGYLFRMASDEEYRSLGITGIMNIPGAQIDSSGLIGMALAFRAAAGEVDMPEDSGVCQHTKPWDAIKLTDSMAPAKREAALKKQVQLLETEIQRTRAITGRRAKLAQETAELCRMQEEKVFQDEVTARINPFKKRKKPGESASKTSKKNNESLAVKSDATIEAHADHEKELRAEPVVDTIQEAILGFGPSHIISSPSKAVPADETMAVDPPEQG